MSDPSAMNIPVHTALTSDMLYGLKPSAPKSRSYRISVAPMNKNIFTPGDQMVFELPVGRRGTYLDQSQSFLKFSVQCSSTAACAVGGNGIYTDNTAYSFIQRLDVWNSSNLLETLNEYGQLCSFLIDTSLSQSDKAGLSTMIGCNGTSVNMNGTGAALAQYASTTAVQVPGDRSGFSMASVINTSAISTAIPYTFCLPLLSGVVGVNSSKMLPVGKLFNPIRMEFYLAANDDAIYYGSTGAGTVWQLVNVEFCACYVEILDDALDPPLQQDVTEYISTKTFRQSSTYMPTATSGEFSCMLPQRAASITALYARFRNYGNAIQGDSTTAAYRKSASSSPSISNYYFRIGSSIYPNKPVYLINSNLTGTGAEGYAELMKTFHALSSSIGNSAITNAQYNVSTTAASGFAAEFGVGQKAQGVRDTHNNAFAIGLECESFSNRSDTILSGISTLNSQIFFTANILSGKTAAANFTIDFFAQMDCILCLTNGVLSAKY